MTHVVAAHLLFLVELRSVLVDARAVVGGVTTEGDVEVLQEGVAAGEERLGLVGVRVDTGLAVKDDDTVGEISGHDEIVLDDEGRLLGVHDESLDDSRGNDTLLGIEVGRGLVDQVDISGDTEGEDNGDTLQFTTGQVLDFLVNKVVELEGFDDIGLELRRQEGLLDLLEEELANSAVELGGDGLRLHADSHLRDRLLIIGLEGTGQEATEGGLSSTVLTHHDDNLRVGKVTRVNVELEVAESLLHLGVGEGAGLVDGKVVGALGDTESQGLVTESQVLSGDVTIKEDVDTLTDRVGQGNDTVNGGATVQDADVVGEIVENRQIVLDDNDVVVVSEERANDQGSTQSLLDIEVRRRLVKHVDVGLLDSNGSDGKTLKLTTREEVDISVHDVVQLQDIGDLLHVAQRGTALDQESHALVGAPDSLGDLVHILGLDDGLEVILQKLGEVVCLRSQQEITTETLAPLRTLQLRATEVLDDVLPVGGVVVSAQVGLELAAQNLESGTLADTVGSDETQNLSRPGHRQAMQLEAVGAIAVGDLALEVGGQVDDGDGVEGALLGADTTTNAERLGDEGEARLGSDFDTELSATDDGARFFALLTTFSRATLKGGVRISLAGQKACLAWVEKGEVMRSRTNLVAVDDGDTVGLACQSL